MSKTIPSQDLRKAKLAANPTCSKCGQTKTPADFPARAVDYWCSACRSAYAIRKYHEKRNGLSPEQLRLLRDKTNKRQTDRRNATLAQMPPQELKEYRERVNAGNLDRRKQVRHRVYMAYGGYRCACCGETEPKFLSIDHINNDGAEHKRMHRLHTGEQMYRWLIRNKFPKGFQILCMNCNWGKRGNDGVCPHSGKV